MRTRGRTFYIIRPNLHGQSAYFTICLRGTTFEGCNSCLAATHGLRTWPRSCTVSLRNVLAASRLRLPKGQETPRLTAEIRISLNKRGGPTHGIELVRQPFGKRSWMRTKPRLVASALCVNPRVVLLSLWRVEVAEPERDFPDRYSLSPADSGFASFCFSLDGTLWEVIGAAQSSAPR